MLFCAYLLFSSRQIDQAVVSLCDKEIIRQDLSIVGNRLRAWLKSTLAERTVAALASVDTIATTARDSQQVQMRVSVTLFITPPSHTH